MLRKLLLLLALLIIVAIGLLWAGIVEWDGNRAEPTVIINPVEVGTEQRQVQTPTLRVDKSSDQPQGAPAPATMPPPAPAPQGNGQ